MQRVQIYGNTATMKNKAKRELANGVDKDPIYKLRLQCIARGASGILGLGRSFRIMDDDKSKALSFEEFEKGILETGLEVTPSEIQDMFNRFDGNGDGSIDLNEFLKQLRPPMNKSREAIIENAFNKMDVNKDGKITIEDLKKVYFVKSHPKFLSGEMTEAQILQKFLNNFEDGSPQKDGIVTKEEFINYYAGVSASIDNDAYFDLLLRRAYRI